MTSSGEPVAFNKTSAVDICSCVYLMTNQTLHSLTFCPHAHEEFEEDWKLLFELYEILKKRVDAREEKMRDYVRKVGLTEKEKNKDEQQ